MRIKEAIQEYLIEIEIRKYTPKTIRSYRNNLNLYLRFCEDILQEEDIKDISLATIRKFTQYGRV